jgi:phospholipid/cholesterol/gamma-HCH transport system permease protein
LTDPLKTGSFRPVAERGEMSIVRASDATVIVRLAGTWELTTGLPSPEPVREELASGRARAVAFDTRELRAWDSAVVTFLARITEICRERRVPLDDTGLPRGVQRLLRLAEAVPERPDVRRSADRRGWLERLGAGTIAAWESSGDALRFLGEVTLSALRLVRGKARLRAQDLMLFVQACGVDALPIVTLISVLVGMILAFVGAVQLLRFGAQIYVADLVAIAMVREMGCIMTAIIMAGRTGSGFAAQLGTMKVTQEIDAFTTLGIPPMDFLVLPRLIALGLMMPLLTVYADVLGIFGGGVVSVGMLGLTPAQYVREAMQALTLTNCATGVGKSFVFGVLIAVAGCQRGMECGKSSSAVGDAATSAVVTSIVLIVVADGLFAVIFHVLGI